MTTHLQKLGLIQLKIQRSSPTQAPPTDDHSPKELGVEEQDVIRVYQEQREGAGGGCSTIWMIFSFKFSSPLTLFNFLN